MTSDRGAPSECYVYLQLPGTAELVTCGRLERATARGGGVIGRFVYGRSYLARPEAVPIDPIHLPLRRGLFETGRLGGMFGAIRDASPDSWGRRIIERQLRRVDLDELEYLLHSPEDRAGALAFGRSRTPPQPTWRFNRVVQLEELREAARRIEAGGPAAPLPSIVKRLVAPGTSLGGARPKSVVEDDEGLWVAKFPQRGDRWSNAAVEGAMLALAARCGIRTPAVRIEAVGKELVLLVKRFDRERLPGGGYLRHRMVSALTVLDAEDSAVDRRDWSYVLLADELQRWSEKPREDKVELFRRMVLNALVSNTDDHPRNHALVAPGGYFRLAPAYDVTPSPSVSTGPRELALVCGSEGRVGRRKNLLSQSPRFGLQRDEAGSIIDEMKSLVRAGWEREVRRHGGGDADCETIAPAIVVPGFEQE